MFSIKGGKKKKKVPEKKVPSVFGGDEDDNEEVKDGGGGPMDWRMEMQRYKRKRVDDEQLQQAMEQDPTFAEYDEVYDSMKSAQKTQVKKKEDVSSKYMETMIRRTEARKIEQEKITARVKRKEIEQEKDVYGETEEFITPAYKKRLEEMEQWTKEQEVIDKQDAEKEYNAGSFLRKMLDDVTETKTAAIQGSLQAKTPSAPSGAETSSSTSAESLSTKPTEAPPKKKPALVAGLNTRKPNEEEERLELEFLERERERLQRLEKEKKEKREQEREAKRRKKYERRNSDADIEEARKRYFERKGLPVPSISVK